MTPSLTHGAFRQMYADQCLLAVGADILETIKPVLPEAVGYLVLEVDGRLRTPDDGPGENPENGGGHLQPIGMALGLKGMIVGRDTEQAALAWSRRADAQSLYDPLEVKVIGGFKRNQHFEAAQFIVALAARQTENLARQMAEKEESLAFLRGKNEWLLLNLEKARRMIRGAGYSLRTITAELPTGSRSIGPGGDIDTRRFRQTLPCDAAGLRGLALRVLEGSPQDLAGSDKPAVCFTLVRASDSRRLMDRTASFRELGEGWFHLELDDSTSMAFGDVALEVVWCDDTVGAGPLFALADLSADRFGDASGDTLALRIYSGIRSLPTHETASTPVAGELLETVALSPAELGPRAVWPFTNKALDEGGEIISFQEDWLQTHALVGAASGAQVPSLLPAGAVSVSASICTAHESGPTCLYVLVALEQGAGDGAPGALIEQMVSDILDGKREMATRSADGIHVACKLIPTNQLHHLDLRFAAPLSAAADLFVAVRPAGAEASYGWCRWSNMAYRMHPSADMTPLADMPGSAESEGLLLMRTQKFPELAGRINFISGKAKLQELGRELGFFPLLISEETGSLQTHPLKDHVSAAMFEGGVPTGALRVASTVETAHDSAPAFLYVIAVLDPEIKEKERAVRNLMQRIKPGDGRTWQGINGQKTVQWQAKMLYARQAALLELELAEAVTKAHDVVFAVKPAVDSVSYGWCRWYSYNVTTAQGLRQTSPSLGTDS